MNHGVPQLTTYGPIWTLPQTRKQHKLFQNVPDILCTTSNGQLMIANEDTGYNFFLKPNQFEGFQDVLARPFLAAKVSIISQGPYQRKPPSHHHRSKAPASVESPKAWWRHYRWKKKWQTYDKHTTNIEIQHHATNGSGYVVGLCGLEFAWIHRIHSNNPMSLGDPRISNHGLKGHSKTQLPNDFWGVQGSN